MDRFRPVSGLFEKIKWAYRQFKLKYSVPFVILLVYTLAGAFIFRLCELDRDTAIRERYRKKLYYAYDQVQRRMMEIKCHDEIISNDSYLQEEHTREVIDFFLSELNLTKTIEERSESSPWTWQGSMFYAGSLYTTIGYGSPSTQTTAGQFATILYIMFGIPLFLTTLKEVGKHLSRLLRKVYKKWSQARQHIPATPAPIRRYSQAMQKQLHISLPSSRQSSIKRKKKKEAEERTIDNVELGLPDHDDGGESDDDQLSDVGADAQKTIVSFPEEYDIEVRHLPPLKDQFDSKIDSRRGTPFPISLALFILLLWICMSAALFCIWEKEWGYFMSVYFFFVSISTVGLGDVVPTDQDMMLANFILILIGLALLSMCINLIQRWIEHLLEDMLQQFVEEFEKIAAVVAEEEEEAKPFEIGFSGTLASAPLAAIGQDHKPWNVADTAKNWFADKLASNLVKSKLHTSRDSLSSSSEDSDWEEDSKPEEQSPDSARRASVRVNAKIRPKRRKSHHSIAAVRAMQLMSRSTPGGGGFKNQLLSKMIASDRMHVLENTIKQKIGIRYASVQTDNEFTELLNFLAIPKHEEDGGSIAGVARSLSQRTDATYRTALERLSSDDSSTIPVHTPTINFMEIFTDSGIAEGPTDSTATTPHPSMVHSMNDETQQVHHLNRWFGMQTCSKCGHISRDGRLLQDRATDPRSSRSKSPAEGEAEAGVDAKRVAFRIPGEDGSIYGDENELSSVYVQPSAVPADREVIADPTTEYRLAVDERHIGRGLDGFRTASSPVDKDAPFHDALSLSSIDADDRRSLMPTRSSPIDLAIESRFVPIGQLPSSISPLSSSRQSLNANNEILRPSSSVCSLVDELVNKVASSFDSHERMVEGLAPETDRTGFRNSSRSSESEAADIISETLPESQEENPAEPFRRRVSSVISQLATALAGEAVAQVSDLPKYVGR